MSRNDGKGPLPNRIELLSACPVPSKDSEARHSRCFSWIWLLFILLEISCGHKHIQAYASLFLNKRHFSALSSTCYRSLLHTTSTETVPYPKRKTPNTGAVRQQLMNLTFTTSFACMATRPLQITFDLYISSCASSCLGGKFFIGWLFSRHGIFFLAVLSNACPASPPPSLADSYKMEKTSMSLESYTTLSKILGWKEIPSSISFCIYSKNSTYNSTVLQQDMIADYHITNSYSPS